MKVIRVPGAGSRQLELFLNGLQTNKVGKVGWFQGNNYPAKKGKPSVPVAYVAAIQEYGDPSHNIPARSFFRTTIAEKEKTWRAIANSEARKMVKGERTAEQALEVIGLRASGDVRHKIATILEPPLSPRTIAARLRDRKIKNNGIVEAYAKDPSRRGLSIKQAKSLGNLYKPLVDTRQLINTLINTVEEE